MGTKQRDYAGIRAAAGSFLGAAVLVLAGAPGAALAQGGASTGTTRPGQSRLRDIPKEYDSAKGLAMGGTGVSYARGLDATYVNPAGVAQSKSLLSEAVLVSPMVTAGEDGKKLYDDIEKGTDTFEMISKHQNKPQHAGVQNVTGVAFRRATMGLLQKGEVDAYAGSDPVTGVPVAEVRAIGRAGVHFGSARSFFDESLFFGVTTKLVQKRELSMRMNALEAQEQLKGKDSKKLLSDNVRQGTGAGADFGLMYRVNSMDVKPSFGAVYRNVGMKYTWGVPKGKRKPEAEKQTLDVGMSIEPGTRKSFSRIAVDYADALDAHKTSPYRRIHLGAELSFQNIVGVMGGVGQGYPSAGAYLNFKVLRVEGGMYGKELGERAGDLRSRRYFARASVGWLE